VSRPGTDPSPGEIDSGFSHYDSIESLVFCDQISCRWVRRFPSNERIKSGVIIIIIGLIITVIITYNVIMLADVSGSTAG